MTVEQLTLDQTVEVDLPRSKLTPADQWELACRDNPQLKPAIVDCAVQLHRQGRRVTAAVLWEELRTRVHTVGDVYQLNNTWRAPAARWLKDAHPTLAAGIRTRGA